MTPHLWSMEQAIQALKSNTCSAEELVQYFLQRIAKYDAGLHAFITTSQAAVEQARQVDEKRAKGLPLGPLAGIPIAVKDLFDTAKLRTTYGGKHYANHVPTSTATAITRLEDAGAIVIGKTNLHEYAYGTTTENPHYGNTTNPWNRHKISGGSSGGSSVALTSGLCLAAVGSDTGGSIRIPAALAGHVGLKPTYGRVSRYGVFPLAPSLDHVGPMAKTVRDAALLLTTMAGPDPRDPTAVSILGRRYAFTPQARPVRVGVPRNFFYDRCQPAVLQGVQNALQRLQGTAFILEEVEIPCMQEAPEAQNVIIASEALHIHANMLRDEPTLYGDDVRRRLEASSQITGNQYVWASEFRQYFCQQLMDVFKQVDVLITPTTPLPATDLGQWKTHIRTLDVNIRGHLTRYTSPWNLSGLPAISIPCGLTPDGLPIGLQVVGWRFTESKLLNIAKQIEDTLVWDPIAPDYQL